MAEEHWHELIRRYANGRQICNCGEAYYTPCGKGIDEKGRYRNDMLVCKNGCSANLIDAKYEIAEVVLKELKMKVN